MIIYINKLISKVLNTQVRSLSRTICFFQILFSSRSNIKLSRGSFLVNWKIKKEKKDRDILVALERDTSDVEFHGEDPKVRKAVWPPHLLLLLLAIYIEQSDGHAPANLEVTVDASSTPLYLFSESSIHLV